MQQYNSLQKPEYNNSVSLNPNKNNLENLVNKNSLFKKVALTGISLFVAANMAACTCAQEQPLTPTLYNPPAVIAPPATGPSTPAETPSLEDQLPDYGPLSVVQIKEYTNTALQLAYEATKEPDFSPERPGKKYHLAEKWLDRALYAIRVSNFDYDKTWALYETFFKWEYGSRFIEKKDKLQKDIEESIAEMREHPDKDLTMELIMDGLKGGLGAPPGWAE